MPSLSEVLRECGCRTDPAELKRSIVSVFMRCCRGLTIEDILADPCGKAIPFTHRVREHLGDYSVPDRVILQTALNLRKQAKIPLLSDDDLLSRPDR